MGIYKRQARLSKCGAGFACTVMALGFVGSFAGVAQADFMKTVSTEAECTAQEGFVMDLNGSKHCLVAVISRKFQSTQYAGDLRGVTSCKKENTRKSQNGDYCLIKLIAKPTVETSPITQTLTDMAKDESKKSAKKKAKKMF